MSKQGNYPDEPRVGYGKRVSDKMASFSICLSDIQKEDVQTGSNGKKYVNLKIVDMPKNNYGKDRVVFIDRWKPDSSKGGGHSKQDQKDDEMPW